MLCWIDYETTGISVFYLFAHSYFQKFDIISIRGIKPTNFATWYPKNESFWWEALHKFFEIHIFLPCSFVPPISFCVTGGLTDGRRSYKL